VEVTTSALLIMYRSLVAVGDQVLAVNGTSVNLTDTADDVANLIIGDVDQKVKLEEEIAKTDDEKNMTLTAMAEALATRNSENKAFKQALTAALGQARLVYNPMTDRMVPWIQVGALMKLVGGAAPCCETARSTTSLLSFRVSSANWRA